MEISGRAENKGGSEASSGIVEIWGDVYLGMKPRLYIEMKNDQICFV